jgi:glycosyltransferase involved in cell wall biosynthesis
MEIIPPFLSADALDTSACERPEFVPKDGGYIMFAGGLGPYKGLGPLIDAWVSLRTKIPLVLAGFPRPDTPSSFPPGVVVAKNVPRPDVLRGWRHSLVAVVPSLWPEPFGTVALEAMAAGKPVVASAVGGLADLVIDGVTGILVTPGDADQLRKAIARLLGDPALRERMGQAGRKRATDYSAKVVVGQWERVFSEVVAARASANDGRSAPGEN